MFNIYSSFIFLLPLFIVPVLIHKWFYAKSSRNQRPPSPRKLPIIGNLHQLGEFPHRSLHSLSKRYGQLMLLHFGSKPVLIASSPEAAREIMKTHDLIFASRPKAIIPDRLVYGSKDIAFAPYGEYWRQVRSISVLHLLHTKRVQSFRSVREEETSVMIQKIAKMCSLGPVNLTNEFILLTNDIVCRVALGRKYSGGENGRKFKLMLNRFTELLGTFNVGDYIPWLEWVNSVNGLNSRVKKVAEEFDEFLEGVVDEHKKKKKIYENESSDFVDILLQLQTKNLLNFSIDNETIKAIILDVFTAGTDTTFAVIDWTMAELLRNPKTMDKLTNEVRQIGVGKLQICEDDLLMEMHYLKAVIKETLRLHTPVSLLVARESTQSIKLMGYDIEAGTQILVNAWAIGRDASLWENPEEFRPERFLNTTIDYKGFDFELLPFGAGRRGCPGMTFAINVIELALANLVHNFNFTLPDDELTTKDVDMTEIYGITVHRKFSLLALATPYNK